MQNHSGYDHFEDVTEDETVKEYGSDLPLDARVYLSLIKLRTLSDSASWISIVMYKVAEADITMSTSELSLVTKRI